MSNMSMTRMHEQWERMKSQLANVREKTEEAMAHGLQAVEVVGASFAAGYANTKWGQDTGGELQIKGVPADLIGFIGGHGLAFLGGAGKYGEHVHNLADGLGAAYGYRAGVHLASQADQP